MPASHPQLPWTDDQWNRLRRVIREEARAARVAGNFLPSYGPLEPDAAYVSQRLLQNPGDLNVQPPGLTVDDTTTLTLSTLQIKVSLQSAQIDDPELASALIAFRRAANVVAHLEDEIIFKGQAGPGQGPTGPDQAPKGQAGTTPWEVSGGERTGGLLNTYGAELPKTPPATGGLGALGEQLVSVISKAVGTLESRYHPGPFACALGHELFQAAQTPNNSLVLPQDRILPFLGGGPLVRSSALPQRLGLLIALAGAPIDLVLATDISVEFLQITPDAWFVFRVYEKMVLRINQADAIERFPLSAPSNVGRRKKPTESRSERV